MRHADPVDPARVTFLLEPWEMLLPADEVVHLLDLDAAEPAHLVLVLRTTLLDRLRPDLRCEHRCPAARLEREPERLLGAVHRRGVVQPVAGVVCGIDHASGQLDVGVERPRRPETDHRAERALLHLLQFAACELAGGEGGRKEPRIVVAPAAHVLERQPVARFLPTGHVDLLALLEPVR